MQCKEESIKHVFNWLYAFVYYYNRIRKHTALDGKTPFKYWQEGVKLTAIGMPIIKFIYDNAINEMNEEKIWSK